MKGILVSGAIAVLVVVVGSILAPMTSEPGRYTDLDGSPAYVDHPTLGCMQDAFYLMGDVICHQQEDRCPGINGNQMPLCHRDLGILSGLVMGLLACIPLWGRLRDARMAAIAVALGFVTVVQWMFNDPSGGDGALRFATGVVSGIGAGLFMGWMLKRNVVNDG